MRFLRTFLACIGIATTLPALAFKFDEGKILSINGGFLAYAPNWDEELRVAIVSAALVEYCKKLDVKGEGGWRLPTKEEVEAIKPRYGMYTPETIPDHRNNNTPRHAVYDSRKDLAPSVVGGQVVCVKKGTRTEEPKAVEKPKSDDKFPLFLTKIPDPPKDTGPTAAQWAEWKRERSQAEEKIAQANATRAQKVAEREVRERQQCMAPGMRGMCSCGRFYPDLKGPTCGK